MATTRKGRFTIPIAPYQPTDDQVQGRSDIKATEKARLLKQQQDNANATHTLGEITTARKLISLKGGRRTRLNRRSKRSRKSRRK
jgi:hypothetical protein